MKRLSSLLRIKASWKPLQSSASHERLSLVNQSGPVVWMTAAGLRAKVSRDSSAVGSPVVSWRLELLCNFRAHRSPCRRRSRPGILGEMICPPNLFFLHFCGCFQVVSCCHGFVTPSHTDVTHAVEVCSGCGLNNDLTSRTNKRSRFAWKQVSDGEPRLAGKLRQEVAARAPEQWFYSLVEKNKRLD